MALVSDKNLYAPCGDHEIFSTLGEIGLLAGLKRFFIGVDLDQIDKMNPRI